MEGPVSCDEIGLSRKVPYDSGSQGDSRAATWFNSSLRHSSRQKTDSLQTSRPRPNRVATCGRRSGRKEQHDTRGFGMPEPIQTKIRDSRLQRGTGARLANKNGGAGSRKGISEQAYVRRASLACGTLLQGKWRVQILCAMRIGPIRLGQLLRLIPNSSRKMLVQNLRSLESDGIVIRRDLSDVLLHVEYDLEPDLRGSICLLMDELSNWGGLYSRKSIGEDQIRQDGFGTEETI